MLGRHRRIHPTNGPAAVVGEPRDIPLDLLEANTWNPNVMADEERERLRKGIRRFGFIVPLTVRPHPSQKRKFEIIDGENRWEVGAEEGLTKFPCWVIDVDTDTAMQLTPILNELHGTPDDQRLAELLKDLISRKPEAEIREVMPFSRERFDEIIGTISVDWEALERQRDNLNDEEERWVERVYRLPADAAKVVDEAIGKAKDEAGSDNDWQGLEFVCAEFMGR